MSENNTINVKGLKKSFGDKVIFDGFEATFKAGKVYLISGANGVGKTTFFRIITGLDCDFDGDVSVGEDIAVAFQEHRLFPQISTIANASVAAEDTEFAKSLLTRFGFTDEDMRKHARHLSGGQKQICSLVRAFASGRGIILLDEPSKELDTEAKAIFREIITEEKRKDKLIVIISHDGDDETVADEIIHF